MGKYVALEGAMMEYVMSGKGKGVSRISNWEESGQDFTRRIKIDLTFGKKTLRKSKKQRNKAVNNNVKFTLITFLNGKRKELNYYMSQKAILKRYSEVRGIYYAKNKELFAKVNENEGVTEGGGAKHTPTRAL